MTSTNWLIEPQWLLAFLISGWLLGWLAVGDRRWAAVPALTTVLAVLGGVFQLSPFDYSTDVVRAALIPVAGLGVLWGVSRLPSLPWRVGVAAALVPLMVTICFLLGGLLFLGIFQIP